MRSVSTLFLISFFFLLVGGYPGLAKGKETTFQIRGGGLIGFAYLLNDRAQDGVSHSGIEMGGSIELSSFDLFPSNGGLRVSTTLRDILLPGSANIFNSGLTLQYENKFELFNRDFYYGGGGGIEYVVAPTQDAGSTWMGYNLKVDIRAQTGSMVSGFYLKFQQIIMDGVKDPLLISVGIEVFYSLWGKSPTKTPTKKIKHEKELKKDVTNPHDSDGDGVENIKDYCNLTLKGRQVEDNGCRPIADGMEFENLKFINGKSSLALDAEKEIARLAELLKANDTIHLVILVEAVSAVLARKRADLIEMKLKKLGIKGERIKTSPAVGTKSRLFFNFRLGI
jgi:outer membrane protein OmpA-like peptidoglycan-associated protein